MIVLQDCEHLPFEISNAYTTKESLRLAYRYLDLRSETMQHTIRMRYKVIKYIRDYMDRHGFCEIETPILGKGTDEGSREFIVPSRVHPGQFYTLPQAPQQLKQMLMAS
jgi:aspartyl-tRNA synthetase